MSNAFGESDILIFIWIWRTAHVVKVTKCWILVCVRLQGKHCFTTQGLNLYFLIWRFEHWSLLIVMVRERMVRQGDQFTCSRCISRLRDRRCQSPRTIRFLPMFYGLNAFISAAKTLTWTSWPVQSERHKMATFVRIIAKRNEFMHIRLYTAILSTPVGAMQIIQVYIRKRKGNDKKRGRNNHLADWLQQKILSNQNDTKCEVPLLDPCDDLLDDTIPAPVEFRTNVSCDIQSMYRSNASLLIAKTANKSIDFDWIKFIRRTYK